MAAEAGISYSSVAMVTDYDCWRESEEAVTVEKVLKVMSANVANVKRLFIDVIARMDKVEWEELVSANQVKDPFSSSFINILKYSHSSLHVNNRQRRPAVS